MLQFFTFTILHLIPVVMVCQGVKNKRHDQNIKIAGSSDFTDGFTFPNWKIDQALAPTSPLARNIHARVGL